MECRWESPDMASMRCHVSLDSHGLQAVYSARVAFDSDISIDSYEILF